MAEGGANGIVGVLAVVEGGLTYQPVSGSIIGSGSLGVVALAAFFLKKPQVDTPGREMETKIATRIVREISQERGDEDDFTMMICLIKNRLDH